jgi:hypothetical protein
MPKYSKQKGFELPYLFASDIVVYFKQGEMSPIFYSRIVTLQTPSHSAASLSNPSHAYIHGIVIVPSPVLVKYVNTTSAKGHVSPIIAALVTLPSLDESKQGLFRHIRILLPNRSEYSPVT